MSFVELHVNVSNPFRHSNGSLGVTQGGNGTVILYGDAPVWEYCNLCIQAVAENAAIVSVGHGIDVTASPDDAIVIYSTNNYYGIGEPLKTGNERKQIVHRAGL
jgi:hypothetical protein